MILIDKEFPSITVKTIQKNKGISEVNLFELAKKENKKILLFFYPKDFTYVCPTELFAFQELCKELEERNVLLFGASCDTTETHDAWLQTDATEGGIKGITYPLISDSNRNLSSILGILDGKKSTENNYEVTLNDNISYRATYLINENGIVFHQSLNNMSLGRNVLEFMRLIDGYTSIQETGEVCPANWEKGKETFKNDRISTAKYLSRLLSKQFSN
ncbi:peroxiredoxin [Flavobacterium oreochromis]|uniref:Thioredoxin peroxidase n=1 Tax=Flavobacterium oreochromis TaxID=2906078 RepID=A0ABW8PAZ8_9FLAO|nr:peroxiredoxin [Flavobacterium oreochromis]OWP75718.1 alkyl hydroperoxide reductase [Flavobacterium oreochromis]POR27281.1 alkyl hydroperoxide reductase [Flavobacterium columnare]